MGVRDTWYWQGATGGTWASLAVSRRKSRTGSSIHSSQKLQET